MKFRTFKLKSHKVLVLVYFMGIAVTACSQNKIPDTIGSWHIEVGPPGNEFYQPPEPLENIDPPPELVYRIVEKISPQVNVEKWSFKKNKYYVIDTRASFDEYDYVFSKQGEFIELEFENDSTNINEKADKLVLRGTKKSISLAEIPQNTLDLITSLFPNSKPNSAWVAETVAGTRYVISDGKRAFYARPDGQIQAAGFIERGALKEIEPPAKRSERSQEQILVELDTLLGQYKERFNFENQIQKLGNAPSHSDGHFRFVVMGDSRSNPDLWRSIVVHINAITPKPAFIINTGDIVPRGLAREYLDYFIPPLLESDIPFFIALGNHDDGRNARAIEYRYLFGENALNYYFDYGHSRFIFIDNVTRVSDARVTLSWLDQILKNTPVGYQKYVTAHQPPGNIEKWAWHAWDEANSKIFAELMTRYKVDHVFLGHIHAYSTTDYNGIQYTITGGGGAGIYKRYGLTGNVHHYLICDVLPDGSLKQQVVRFYKNKEE